MTLTEAAAILRRYNDWRTGGPDYLYDPAQITEAIDVAIQVMEGRLYETVTDCNEIYDHVPDAGKMVPADLETIRREAFEAGRATAEQYTLVRGNFIMPPKYPTADDYINSLKEEESK